MSVIQRTATLGIDLGGTSLRVGLFDPDMQLVGSESVSTRVNAGPDAVIADMAQCVKHMVAAFPEVGPVSGIGLGSPGPLDIHRGTLGLLPNFPGWDGYPLRQSLCTATSLPVFLECDANAAALGEWKLGAGRTAKVDSMAMITLGTGVGSGMIVHGKIAHGMVGMGGELGHTSVDRQGPECPCGSRGCLELFASATGLVRLARGVAAEPSSSRALRELADRPGGFTARELALLAERGDSAAIVAFEQLGEHLGFGLASLINLLDFPLVVVGGGVASAWNLFAPRMFQTVKQYSIVYRLGEPSQLHKMERNKTFITPAELGPAAGLLGAALLPRLPVSPEH